MQLKRTPHLLPSSCLVRVTQAALTLPCRYDLTRANLVDDELDKYTKKGFALPDVVLVSSEFSGPWILLAEAQAVAAPVLYARACMLAASNPLQRHHALGIYIVVMCLGLPGCRTRPCCAKLPPFSPQTQG